MKSLPFLLAAAALLAGCGDSLLPPRSEEPVLYLVLTRDSIIPPNPSSSETRLTALLTTAGLPTRVELRSAEEFSMWADSDPARFGWRELPPSSAGSSHPVPLHGNYVLPETAAGGLLGREDLRPGERYRLRIVTAGRVVTGEAVLPERPVLTLVEYPDRSQVEWQPVRGAAAYLLPRRGDDRTGDQTWNRITTDTFEVVARHPEDRPDMLTVMAVDANVAAFFRDSSKASAGITGALGIFGGSARSTIVLRPVK